MSFKKYFNEILYLEGSYDSSDSSEIREFQPIDAVTNEPLKSESSRYYYPTKCGEWKLYLNDKFQERLNFEKCKCL